MAAKKNIKAMYDNCKNLVREIEDAVENGKEIDKNTLKVICDVYEDIIEFEKMFLIQCNDKFWGAVLMNMSIEIDVSQRGPLDIKVNQNPMAISMNPLFLADYTFPEFTGLIINELTKLVYMHPSEYGRLNSSKDTQTHKLLDDSSSAASTSIVKSDIRLENNEFKNMSRLPNDVYTDTSVSRDCSVQTKTKMPIDYYFKILKKFRKDPPPTPNGPGNDIGSVSDMVATKNNGIGRPIHDWEGSDSEETSEAIKSIIQTAWKACDDRSRGYTPAGIVQQINAILAPPEIDWKMVLRRMVGSIPVPYRKTKTRLNRRQPYRADLCGRLPKRTVNIVCAFDTSGSMSDEDLKYCLNEVFNIIKVYEGYKVTIIECDAEIGKIYEARNMSEVQMKMSGRGGTSFIPVIEYINGIGKYKNNKKYPNAGKYSDALFVYFTDGYGDAAIPKPKTYRNLWVVMEDEKNLSVKDPYGDVKSLKKDKDWKKMKGM